MLSYMLFCWKTAASPGRYCHRLGKGADTTSSESQCRASFKRRTHELAQPKSAPNATETSTAAVFGRSKYWGLNIGQHEGSSM